MDTVELVAAGDTRGGRPPQNRGKHEQTLNTPLFFPGRGIAVKLRSVFNCSSELGAVVSSAFKQRCSFRYAALIFQKETSRIDIKVSPCSRPNWIDHLIPLGGDFDYYLGPRATQFDVYPRYISF